MPEASEGEADTRLVDGPAHRKKLRNTVLALMGERRFAEANVLLEVLLNLGDAQLPVLAGYAIVQSELGRPEQAERSLALARSILDGRGRRAAPTDLELVRVAAQWLPGGRHCPAHPDGTSCRPTDRYISPDAIA